MPQQGQILVNPDTGDTFEFLETAASTDGQRVVIKSTVKSRGPLVPPHLHLLQDEQFEVVSGRLTYLAEGQQHMAVAGECVSLPKNKPHNHYNGDPEPLVYVHTVSPALDFDYFIENLVGLAADGKLINGKAGLLQELVTLRYLDSKAFLAGIPMPVQKILLQVLAPVARLLGYRAIYRKYSGFEK